MSGPQRSDPRPYGPTVTQDMAGSLTATHDPPTGPTSARRESGAQPSGAQSSADSKASGVRFIDRMLERLYAAIGAGPAINCRPHNSRQRVDLQRIAQLLPSGGAAPAGGSDGEPPEDALLGKLLSARGTARVAARAPAPRRDPSDPLATDEDRAAAAAFGEQQRLLQRLRVIAEDARSHEQQTGLWPLFIGFPLLHVPPRGRGAAAGPRVLAPLCFIPVTLRVQAGRTGGAAQIEISCAQEGGDRVVPNSALLAWLERQTGARIGDLFADEEGTEPWREINEVAARVCAALELPAPVLLTSATSLLATPRGDDSDRTALLPAAVLGLFPLANQSLLRDLQAMARGEDLRGPVESFLRCDLSLAAPPAAGDSTSNLDAPRDFSADRLVERADPCQARAVQLAQTSRGLVIHGPPGTGKSQTITNIIGDHLARGQRVLFVCDKRTAIDVVYRRLEQRGLASLCAVVHDARRDQRDLYRSLHKQLDDLAESGLPTGGTPRSGRTEADAASALRESDRELAGLHATLRGYERALATPDAAEPSFHDLVGAWLALPDPDAVNADADASVVAIAAPPPSALPACEPAVAEILERAEAEAYPHNPLRDRLGCDLPVLLRRSHADWQRALTALVDVLRGADAAPAAGPPFDLTGDVAAEGAQRTALGERLAAVLAPAGGGPVLNAAQVARLAGLSREARRGQLEQLRAVAPVRATAGATPLDRDLLSALRGAAGTGLSQVLAWLSALVAYLAIARRWYGFFYFRRRRAARAVLRPFGLPLAASSAERLQTFLHGVRARQELEACRAQLLKEPDGDGLPTDPDLLVPLAAGEELLTTLEELEGDARLAACAGALRHKLCDPAQHDALLAVLAAAGPRSQTIARAEAALTEIGIFSEQFRADIAGRLRRGEPVAELFGGMPARAASLEGVLRVERSLCALPPPLGAATRALALRGVAPAAGLLLLRKGVLRGEILRRLERTPVLQELDAPSLQRLQARLHAVLEARPELVRDLVRARWTARQRQRLLASTGTRLGKAGAELRRRLALRGERALQLRQVIDLGQADPEGDPLLELRPVWMASPETVARIFPRRALFDVVIFDEASQCRLEEALPVLLRAGRVVIAGDPRQLPPTRFFESALVESQEAEPESDQELFEAQLGETEDLLAAALGLEIDQCYLDVHYRSRHEGLISFSNEHFYDGRLQPIPTPPRTRRPPALALRPVAGCYEKGGNPVEARAVVALLGELLARPSPPSVGIACFNLTQRELISDALAEAEAADPAFADRLRAARERPGEGLFVKNLESVQGDERDQIILSTTYGPDSRGRFFRRFGPLGQAGGGRRLNVLVTRAREQVHVVTSIPAEAYRRVEPLAEGKTPGGGWLLLAYLRHVEGAAQAAAQTGASHGPASVPPHGEGGASPAGARMRSPVAVALAQHLRQAGVAVRAGWGNEGFWVDLLLSSESAEGTPLAVLCDFARYEKAQDRVEWDLFRDTVFAQQGLRPLRLFTPQLFREPAAALARLARDVEVQKSP